MLGGGGGGVKQLTATFAHAKREAWSRFYEDDDNIGYWWWWRLVEGKYTCKIGTHEFACARPFNFCFVCVNM